MVSASNFRNFLTATIWAFILFFFSFHFIRLPFWKMDCYLLGMWLVQICTVHWEVIIIYCVFNGSCFHLFNHQASLFSLLDDHLLNCVHDSSCTATIKNLEIIPLASATQTNIYKMIITKVCMLLQNQNTSLTNLSHEGVSHNLFGSSLNNQVAFPLNLHTDHSTLPVSE